MFPLFLLNQVTFTVVLFFCMSMGHDRSLPGIVGHIHMSRSEVKIWLVGPQMRAGLVAMQISV